MNSNSEFYAYYLTRNIDGVIEIDNHQDISHIQSLVVDPKYFRKGIGRKLVQFILDTYKTKLFTIETGIDNQPAIKLYKSFGFQELEQWDTNHGIRKVRFEKRI